MSAKPADWTVDRYQSANRLAHAVWLGDRMPTVLAHVLFHGDPTHRNEPERALTEAAREVYRGLGVSRPPAFAITVPFPAADPAQLAPATLPDWASGPFVLDGLDLASGAYAPYFGETTRLETPEWALVGGCGWDHDEIAIAAFADRLEFSSLGVHWVGHEPLIAAKPLQRVAWGEFPPAPRDALAVVTLLAQGTARRRRGTYRRCAECNEWVAPEHRDQIDGRPVCHGCQERYHGIVH